MHQIKIAVIKIKAFMIVHHIVDPNFITKIAGPKTGA
jgi:hypothetical protein